MSDAGMVSNMRQIGRSLADRLRPEPDAWRIPYDARVERGSFEPISVGYKLDVWDRTMEGLIDRNPDAMRRLFEQEQPPPEPHPERFPIMMDGRNGKRVKAFISWHLAELMREGAMRNHGQSIERLAERGGLSWREAIHCLANMRYGQMSCDESQAQFMMAGAAHALDRVRGK